TIPGGKFGLWLVAGLGIFSCIVTILIGLLKPNNIVIDLSHTEYAVILFTSILLFASPPFIYNFLRKNKI
ncbi:MAG: amino acid permease, partial [Gammaproteobacteria bacterium]